MIMWTRIWKEVVLGYLMARVDLKIAGIPGGTGTLYVCIMNAKPGC
jgi:hypothetical protein